LRQLLDYPVLVLNLNYEPLNVCNVKRAITLVVVGKAEVLENSRGIIRTPSTTFLCPSVIKLAYMIRRPRPRVKLTKKEIFRRDNYTCQYCGSQSKSLTVDHVVPRHHGGQHKWENLVSACPACNHRKGGRTLQEVHMQLLRLPHEPRATSQYLFGRYVKDNRKWEQFIEGW
jgi:5-methylcytosine-specific restriction endonuclease McrA